MKKSPKYRTSRPFSVPAPPPEAVRLIKEGTISSPLHKKSKSTCPVKTLLQGLKKNDEVANEIPKEQLNLPKYTGAGKHVPSKALNVLGEDELKRASQKVVPGDPDARGVGVKVLNVLGGEEQLMPKKVFKRMGTGTKADFAMLAANAQLATDMEVKRKRSLEKTLSIKAASDEQLKIPKAHEGQHVPEKALAIFGDEHLERQSLKQIEVRGINSGPSSPSSVVRPKALTKLGIDDSDTNLIPEKARSRLGSICVHAKIKADEQIIKEREKYLKDILRKKSKDDAVELPSRTHSSSLQRFKNAAMQVVRKAHSKTNVFK